MSSSSDSEMISGASEPLEGAAQFSSGFTHGFASAGDVRLHYVRGGTGRPVILLHGFPATWYDWHRIMPELAKSRDVIAIDLPGLGDSDIPTEGFDLDSAAQRISAAVDSLNIQAHDLIAHDVGAWVGYHYLRDFGRQVGRAIVMETRVPGFGLEQNLGRLRTWHFAFHAGDPAFAAELVKGKEELYLNRFYDKFSSRTDAIDAKMRAEFIRCYSRPGSLEAAFRYYAAVSEAAEKNRNRTDKLSMPILAIGGEFAAGTCETSWNQVAANLQTHRIAGVGHYLVEENPTEFLSIATQFLNAVA